MSRFVLLIVVPLFLALPVSAQVVRDGSMGPPPLDPSVDPDLGLAVDPGVDPNGASADYLISADLGETSGSSLFHSFDQFSVSEGQVATFTGPATIDLIVSRTTGTEGSFLFGTLRSTIPNAELFFLSPGGLVIGEGAQLDVPGSVHFSTASVVRFGADPLDDLPTGTLARPTLLSSAPPSAFGFGPDPAPISVGVVDSVDHSKTLSVRAGETLSFVGGAVTLTGLPNAAPFFYQGNVIGAPGATVELASTAGDLDIPLAQVDGRTRLDLTQLPHDALDGEVMLQQNARINVGGGVGTDVAAGSVIVRAGSFRILDGRIEATHRSNVVDGGVFDLGARDRIEIDAARITSGTAAAGRGPDVQLASREVSIGGDSLIRIISAADGASGDFTAEAQTVSLVEGAEISSLNTAAGAGGAIRIRARDASGTGRIEIRGDGASPDGLRLPSSILSNPRGAGAGGEITLESDAIVLSNNGDVLSIARGGATAAGGAIEIRTTDLAVESGSFVATSTGRAMDTTTPPTEGQAPGGALRIEGLDGARADRVRVSNAGGEREPAAISTNTLSPGEGAGRGGDLTLRAQQLELVDGGQVFANTQGAGVAGALQIEADAIRIAGVLANPAAPTDPFRSGITSRVATTGATGSGTRLSINTRLLEVQDGGQISTATFGIGDAGDLEITARERMTVRGGANGASLVSAQAVAGPTEPGGGNGGTLTIETGHLELRDGGLISASTAGRGDPGDVGDAGDVVIRAGSVEIIGAVDSELGIFSVSDSQAAAGVGNGGNVTVEVRGDMLLSGGGRVEVTSSGDGAAGNVRLDVGGSLYLLDGARILSTSDDQSRGSAGAVEVFAARDLVLNGGSEISASTGVESTGAGGSVTVRSGSDVRLSSASRIRSSSDGRGDAGDIQIAARRVFASSGSAISTAANSASGGSITVDAAERFELVGASTTTSVQGQVGSDAGSIEIRTPGHVVVNAGVVVAQAVEGAGGRIEIRSDGSFISGESVISASSEEGPQGELDLTPPESALISELATLPAALVDPSQLLHHPCDLRTEREGSFTVRASPAAAAPPDASLSADLTTQSGPSCE